MNWQKNHIKGNGQFIDHAKALLNSLFYSGNVFSWGDGRIYEIANQDHLEENKRKSGNLRTWVEISQNHHITLIDSLLNN